MLGIGSDATSSEMETNMTSPFPQVNMQNKFQDAPGKSNSTNQNSPATKRTSPLSKPTSQTFPSPRLFGSAVSSAVEDRRVVSPQHIEHTPPPQPEASPTTTTTDYFSPANTGVGKGRGIFNANAINSSPPTVASPPNRNRGNAARGSAKRNRGGKNSRSGGYTTLHYGGDFLNRGGGGGGRSDPTDSDDSADSNFRQPKFQPRYHPREDPPAAAPVESPPRLMFGAQRPDCCLRCGDKSHVSEFCPRSGFFN